MASEQRFTQDTYQRARLDSPISKVVALLDVDLDDHVKLASPDLFDRLCLVPHRGPQRAHIGVVL